MNEKLISIGWNKVFLLNNKSISIPEVRGGGGIISLTSKLKPGEERIWWLPCYLIIAQ